MTLPVAQLSELMILRDRKVREMRAMTDGQRKHPTRDFAKRESLLMAEIAKLDTQLRETVGDAATIERTLEQQRALGIQWRSATDEPSGRSLGDVAPFGEKLGQRSADQWFPMHDVGTAPLVLDASGKGSRLLPLIQTFPFGKIRGLVPITPKFTAQVVAANDAADVKPGVVTSNTEVAVKAAVFAIIPREEIEDQPVVEQALVTGAMAALGQRADQLILHGATTDDATTTGLLTGSGAVTTTVTAFDAAALFAAQARVQNSGGLPTAVIGRPDDLGQLLATIDTPKLKFLPPLVEIPDLADGTVCIPSGTLLVADLDSVAAAIRSPMEYKYSTNSAVVFGTDQVLLGARFRLGSAVVAAPGRVQILSKNG